MRTLALLLLLVTICAAGKKKRQQSEWDFRSEAEKVNMRGCANLTTVLDNWKFAIMTQVKDLLLNDHSSVLPEYGRITSLSEALGDLYKEFNALKERLGDLTTKFDGIEGFVDEMKARRSSTLSRQPQPNIVGQNTPSGARPESSQRVKVVRKAKKPSETTQK
uniref:Si:dkey-282h22.5 n=1 Tax=Erpetoichthys calabaricus TaxID=27687 RepID=A0A8C4T9Z2_ERPCA